MADTESFSPPPQWSGPPKPMPREFTRPSRGPGDAPVTIKPYGGLTHDEFYAAPMPDSQVKDTRDTRPWDQIVIQARIERPNLPLSQAIDAYLAEEMSLD